MGFRSQWRKLSPKLQKEALWSVPLAMFIMVSAIGIIFGFNGLKPILEKYGVYASSCKPGEAQPCDHQVQYDSICFFNSSCPRP
jgi:hypothetical protein